MAFLEVFLFLILDSGIFDTHEASGEAHKAGMTERQNDGIVESRNVGKSPQILGDGMTEWWKIPQNPKGRNGGKSPEVLEDGMIENRPKSLKMEQRKVTTNP